MTSQNKLGKKPTVAKLKLNACQTPVTHINTILIQLFSYSQQTQKTSQICEAIKKYPCTVGKPCHWKLCRAVRGRWLRECSEQIWWSETTSSCCYGNQAEEADRNLWILPSKERTTSQINMGHTHKYECKHKTHTSDPEVRPIWTNAGSTRVTGQFNLIQSGL